MLDIGLLLAILLLVATAWSLSLGLQPTAVASAPADCASGELADECERWDELWEQIDRAGLEALAVSVDAPDLRPAGDTCGMRYRDVFRHAPTAAHFKMRLAAFSNRPEQKAAILDEVTRSDDARVRFRAGVEQARVALRQGEPAAALAVVTALDSREVPAPCRADADFIEAYAALQLDDPHRAERLLAQTVATDPGFWNARRLQTEVLSRLLVAGTQDAAACLARTRRIIENLGAMASLANDLRQLRDLASEADRAGNRNNPALMLTASLGYRWAGDPERAEATLAAIMATSGRLPRACEAMIIERANVMGVEG